MNDTIQTIDAELKRMGNDTVAISYTSKEDLPDEIKTLFDETPTFHLEYDGEQTQYLNIKKGFSKEDFTGLDWGTFHVDGEAHLESVKRDIINQQRKQRRFGLR